MLSSAETRVIRNMVKMKIYILIISFFTISLFAQQIVIRDFESLIIDYNDDLNWQVNDHLKIYRGNKHIGFAEIKNIEKRVYAIITQEDSFIKIKKGDITQLYQKEGTTPDRNFYYLDNGIHVGINTSFNDIFESKQLGYKIGLSFLRNSKKFIYFEPSIKMLKGNLSNKIVRSGDYFYKSSFTYDIKYLELAFLYHQKIRIKSNKFFINIGPALNISIYDNNDHNFIASIYNENVDNEINKKPKNYDYHTIDGGSHIFFENSYIGYNIGLGFTIRNKPIEIRYTSTQIKQITYHKINERINEVALIIILSNWFNI